MVLASRCVWREVRGLGPRRPHVSRGSGAGSSARPGQPVRATAGRFPRLEEELNILQALPPELLLYIFKFIGPKELCRISECMPSRSCG